MASDNEIVEKDLGWYIKDEDKVEPLPALMHKGEGLFRMPAYRLAARNGTNVAVQAYSNEIKRSSEVETERIRETSETLSALTSHSLSSPNRCKY